MIYFNQSEDSKTLAEIKQLNQYAIEKQRIIKEAFDSNQEYTTVFIIGSEGSGKSTLICSLLGEEVKIQKSPGSRIKLHGKGIYEGCCPRKMSQIEISKDSQIVYYEYRLLEYLETEYNYTPF